jgi:hypothetical protein
MIPEMNWHTPPKKRRQPTMIFGVATPRTSRPKLEIRKMPIIT